MRVKPVLRFDPSWPKLRLARVMWKRGEVGDGNGYSSKLSFALRPSLFRFYSSWDGWRIVLLGVEVHMQRSWGGIYT